MFVGDDGKGKILVFLKQEIIDFCLWNLQGLEISLDQGEGVEYL